MKKERSITVQRIEAEWLRQHSIVLDVLRLDKWHPTVSGNKWFKLQYYLKDARDKSYSAIATFGGAYSNHIVATAFACREMELNCIGIIRGEEPPMLSHTLCEAQEYGMQLTFMSREKYRDKEAIKTLRNDVYWINEGGYGALGADGASEILRLINDIEAYSYLVCAVGTGTTLAGMIKNALPHQTVFGFSALRNNRSLEEEVKQLLSEEERRKKFAVIHDYHFGGYAKYTPALLSYMNAVWQEHHLPLDFVYTAKALYGLEDMIRKDEIVPLSHILFVHTGGLQGNKSLPENTLLFS